MPNTADMTAESDRAWTIEMTPDEERRALRYCRRRGINREQFVVGMFMWWFGINSIAGPGTGTPAGC